MLSFPGSARRHSARPLVVPKAALGIDPFKFSAVAKPLLHPSQSAGELLCAPIRCGRFLEQHCSSFGKRRNRAGSGNDLSPEKLANYGSTKLLLEPARPILENSCPIPAASPKQSDLLAEHSPRASRRDNLSPAFPGGSNLDRAARLLCRLRQTGRRTVHPQLPYSLRAARCRKGPDCGGSNSSDERGPSEW